MCLTLGWDLGILDELGMTPAFEEPIGSLEDSHLNTNVGPSVTTGGRYTEVLVTRVKE